MALKNTRIGTDQRFALSLSNAGAKVNMNDVEVLHLCMYSNDQRSNDGSIGYAVNSDDTTVLDLLWLAKSQSYLGSHSVHGTIRYAGAVASFDIPAVNVVSKTSEADISTDTIVLEAPVGTEDLTATITIQGIGPQGPQGPKGDKMTYADLTQEDKENLYEGVSEVMKPLLATKQNTLTDTDGGYGQRVAELETRKQDTLTAGNGISIVGGVIGVTGEISSKQDHITDLEEIRSNATNGNEAAEAVRQMNTDLIYKHRTMSEALASFEARLAALESSRGLLGEATAGRLDVTELTTCLYPRVLYGHGVPSASVIPENLPKGLPWDGVPVFTGQQYINLDATSAGLYYAKGHDSVSDWKQA